MTILNIFEGLGQCKFIKPFVKGNKNDFVDAEAICEAASRPSMRFVSPKTEAQQTLSVLHRLRETLIRDRAKAVNQMHGFLLELGISLPTWLAIMKRLASVLAEHELPVRLMLLLQRLHDYFVYLDEQIKALDKELASQLADDDLGSRLLSMPCVGPITASVSLVPRQYSTGGKANLLGVSKRGDKNLRRLLVQCFKRLEHQKGVLADWVRSLLMRRHSSAVACALANKLARIAWAIAANHTEFEAGSSPLGA